MAYTVATPDMEANRNATNLWMAPVAGGDAIQLTRTREGFFTGVVAGWKDDCVSVVAQRGFASLCAVDGRRRGASVDEAFDRRGYREVVAGRKDHCVYVSGRVIPDCKDDACNQKRNDEKEKNKVKAHVAENLLVPPLDALE